MADARVAKANLLRRAEQSHARAVADVLRQLEVQAPKDTRQLSRSLRATPQRTNGGIITATVYVDAPRTPPNPDNVAVAAFNEFGTRAHIIRAKNRKALRWQQGGQTRFAKSVRHPGTRARPWFYPVLRRWGDTLRRSFR